MATGDQIASPGAYVTDDVGFEVTDGSASRVQLGLLPGGDYGLRVVAPGGATVIIDGKSDMFKIAATGTLNAPAISTGGESVGTVTLTTGLTYVPQVTGMVQLTVLGGPNDFPVPLAVFVGSLPASPDQYYTIGVNMPSSGQTQVNVSAEGVDGFPAQPFRYYVLEQQAF